MRFNKKIFIVFYLLVVTAAFVSCERGRPVRETPPFPETGSPVRQTELVPGAERPQTAVTNPYERDANAIMEGKRLYDWYNCGGCHFHGGGGIGPPLMDDSWIYGSNPENIYATIVEGRPNGMPAFGEKIPPEQVWKIAAFVRYLGGFNEGVLPEGALRIWEASRTAKSDISEAEDPARKALEERHGQRSIPR